MKRQFLFSLASVAAVLFCAAAARGADANPVAAIQQAANINELSKAYLAALATDRKNPQVYQVYINKLLEMGLAPLAATAAEQLRKLDGQSEDPLAAGVIGYSLAKRYKIGEALPLLVRAAKADPENPGLIHDIAVLSVWINRSEDKATAPGDAATLVSEMAEQLKGKGGYEQAHVAATAAFDNRANKAKALQDKLPQYQEAINKIKAEGANLDSAAAQLQSQWNMCDSAFRQAQQNLQQLNATNNNQQNQQNQNQSQYQSQRQSYVNAMNQARNDAARVRQEYNRLASLAASRTARIKRAQQDIDNTTKAIEEAGKRDPVLEWKPPAVNGKIVVDTTAPPAGGTAAKSDTPPAGTEVKTDPPVPGGEVKTPPSGTAAPAAAGQLKRAKMFLANDMRDKAVKLLEEILDKYPTSDEAKEAQELLDKK